MNSRPIKKSVYLDDSRGAISDLRRKLEYRRFPDIQR